MKKIRHLPPSIIAKIAAGEVIERPAYAVKELIENAIDAKANCVTVEVEKAGLKKIVVTDNGEGMGREDIEVCFQPHTTSKIIEENELSGIKSLGFRGEALSSIAAVSLMTVKSRSGNETGGTQIQLQAGKPIKISPFGMPTGTRIVIEKIFGNVPARKKFLKTARTEFRQIVDVVMRYAIAFPKIRFFLSHDRRIVLDFSLKQDLLDRISLLLGKDVFDNLITVKYEDSYIKISGFISRPQVTTQSSSKHFIFVNNRFVSDKAITFAVKEAYGSLLEATSYPVFILFLSLPYEAVDVNVHPRKEQVSFLNNQLIFEHVFKAVSQTLSENNLTFQSVSWKNDSALNTDHSGTGSFAGKLLKENVLPWQIKEEVINSNEITQLHDLYLVVQTQRGVLLIDQHAAHERILFEQFSAEFQNQKNKRRVFQLPQTISFDLPISDAEALKEHSEIFFSLGFTLDNFSGTTFTLRTIPLLVKDRNIRDLIRELLEDIAGDKKIKSVDMKTRKMLEYLACKAAIKAGEKLSKEEAKRLILQLEKTPNNATCPHARPAKIEITKEQLNRMFKRK